MCECEICQYGREFERQKAGLTAEQTAFFDGMYTRMVSAQADHEWALYAFQRFVSPDDHHAELNPTLQSALDALYVALKISGEQEKSKQRCH